MKTTAKPKRSKPVNAIREHSVGSVDEYLRVVVSNAQEWLAAWRPHTADPNPKLEIWYRGIEKKSYSLMPSAYRGNKDAGSAFHRFTAMAQPYMERIPQSDWEWYFAAQHYGVATRLLDWTEDAMVALHFALTAELASTKLDASDPPCVWVIEAAAFNYIVHEEDMVFVIGGPQMAAWSPDGQDQLMALSEAKRKKANAYSPVAVLPPWSTQRIFRQRGRFTIHGVARRSIDDYFLESKLTPQSKFITRIKITDIERVTTELKLLGFAKHHLYPEAANLGEHLMRSADYTV
jgi:hypothetical protein